MPPQVVATLDDVAAMLGFYKPLPEGQAAHLAGPVVQWRSHRQQPIHDRVTDIEMLAMKQRALISFGGAPVEEMVGTAEIVNALGNLHPRFVPDPYYQVFHWASIDVLAHLSGDPKEKIWKEKGWNPVEDADVLTPGGAYYAAHQEISTHLRREAIAGLKGQEDHPRRYLRPLAAAFVGSHRKARDKCLADGETELAARLDEQIETILAMFPDLGDSADEAELLAFKERERTEQPAD